jgi:hypothetical protein
MANKLQNDQPKEDKMEHAKRETLGDLIREQVLHTLGTPTDLRTVQVEKVWDNHYRVNVFVGANAGCVRVSNSFFLVTDSDGSLIASTPKITKQY